MHILYIVNANGNHFIICIHVIRSVIIYIYIMALSVDQYYLFISSNQCDNMHPSNNITKFSVDLPTNLLLNGQWEVALIEVNFKASERQVVYILADFCQESLVEGKFLPIMKRLTLKKGLNNGSCIPPIYIPLSRTNIKTINFYILDNEGKPASLVNKTSFLTLHIRKRTYGLF